ncbi:MAG TPA: hypothetical protein PLR99_27720 [Polyangiaceae bacterium]|nr:hypothetical protein [Polyangiaceae bacterium]
MGSFPNVRARFGASAAVWFVVLCGLVAGIPRTAVAETTTSSLAEAPAPTTRRTVLAFAPENRGGKQPVFVYLHGIVGGPERGCAEFAHSVPTYGWLVCPHANVREGQRYSWGGPLSAQWAVVQHALAQVAEEPEVDPRAPVVLLGFSQGAYVAAQLVTAYPNKIRAVLFVGANVRPSKDALGKAGVKKVGFAAGLFDGTHAYLNESARQLEQGGYPAQFRSLGRVGHTYVGDAQARAIDSLVSWMAND